MVGTAMMFIGFLNVLLSISGGFEISVFPLILYFAGVAIWGHAAIKPPTLRYVVITCAIALGLAFFHYGEVLFWHKQVIFWATVALVVGAAIAVSALATEPDADRATGARSAAAGTTTGGFLNNGPTEIMVRNLATGSFAKRYGLKEGEILEKPIVEYYLKNNAKDDQMVNQHHVVAFGLATADELKMVERYVTKANAVLKAFFIRRGLKLVDFKLEFGRYKNHILVGDELSLDNCRWWDAETGEKARDTAEDGASW